MPKFNVNFYLIPFVLGILLSFVPMKTLDVSIHDMYIVVKGNHVYFFVALLYLLFYLPLFTLKKLGYRTISKPLFLHFLVTTIGLVGLMILSVTMQQKVTRYTDYSVYDEFDPNALQTLQPKIVLGIVVVIAISQLAYFWAVFRALVRKK